ncbi:alpha/beta hydrolase [Janibacter corallicola]|uniref:alpha/beta hydrolase n=1 Tax=Janibacter corallicola TaxID=415212 RepID=UPI00082A79DC|nr:alpha/beta hydrolase [Janibacter corallicola]
MKRPYPGMAPLTTALTVYLDTVGRRPIEEATPADIAASRAQVYPTFPPFSWITGSITKGVTVTEEPVTTDEGVGLPVRWYRPSAPTPRPRPLLVYFHGGGWVQGSTRMYDPLCSFLAERVDAVVASVDYRMAPEHRAPTAARDAIAFTRTLAGREDARHDPDRIGLVGDSAGGNLAAVVAQQLRDLRRGGRPVIRHQALIYPATDLTLASPSIREHAHAPILTEAGIEAFRRLYLGGEDGFSPSDPLVSPLFGDLSGAAPALVQTGELDPIRDDGLRYVRALETAGVPVRGTTYVGVPHGFASFPGATPVGAQHRAELVQQIRTHLQEEET